MAPRIAFVTGMTGQDGSCVAELPFEKDDEVRGMVRRTALEAPEQRLTALRDSIAS